MYLSDLTFISDGNPNTIDDLINFRKRFLVYRVIEQIKKYQNDPYHITPKEPIATFLRHFPVFSDSDLFSLSLAREPREQIKKGNR